MVIHPCRKQVEKYFARCDIFVRAVLGFTVLAKYS